VKEIEPKVAGRREGVREEMTGEDTRSKEGGKEGKRREARHRRGYMDLWGAR